MNIYVHFVKLVVSVRYKLSCYTGALSAWVFFFVGSSLVGGGGGCREHHIHRGASSVELLPGL